MTKYLSIIAFKLRFITFSAPLLLSNNRFISHQNFKIKVTLEQCFSTGGSWVLFMSFVGRQLSNVENQWFRPGMSNWRPAGRMRPLCLFCVARIDNFIMQQFNNIVFTIISFLVYKSTITESTKNVIKHI